MWHFPCASWITASRRILCEDHCETCNTTSKGGRGSRRWWKDDRHPHVHLVLELHLVSNVLMSLDVPLRTYHLVTSTYSLSIDRHPQHNSARHSIEQARHTSSKITTPRSGQAVNSRYDRVEKHNSPGWYHGVMSARYPLQTNRHSMRPSLRITSSVIGPINGARQAHQSLDHRGRAAPSSTWIQSMRRSTDHQAGTTRYLGHMTMEYLRAGPRRTSWNF